MERHRPISADSATHKPVKSVGKEDLRKLAIRAVILTAILVGLLVFILVFEQNSAEMLGS